MTYCCEDNFWRPPCPPYPCIRLGRATGTIILSEWDNFVRSPLADTYSCTSRHANVQHSFLHHGPIMVIGCMTSRKCCPNQFRVSSTDAMDILDAGIWNASSRSRIARFNIVLSLLSVLHLDILTAKRSSVRSATDCVSTRLIHLLVTAIFFLDQ